jgi:hypothetical protein
LAANARSFVLHFVTRRQSLIPGGGGSDRTVGLKAVVQRGKALAALNALPGVKVARVKRAAAPERWVMTRWTGGAKNVGDKVQE